MKKIIIKVVAFLFDKMSKYYFYNLYNEYRKKYSIDDTFRFNGRWIEFYGNGEIVCGKDSYIGNYSTIQSLENQKVIIGNNTRISHNVRIYTHNLNPNQDLALLGNLKYKNGDVIIGNNVWIGANVFINQNITIGDNAVVGANSVVTRDIEANTVCAGAPAKVLYKKTTNK